MSHDVNMLEASGKSNSRALESVEFDRDFGGFVVVRNMAVPHKQVRPLSETERTWLDKENIVYPGTLITSSVNNQGNTGESRLTQRFYPKNDEDTVYPTKTTRQVDRSALARFADTTQVRQSYVQRNTALGTVDPLTISTEQDLYGPDLDYKRTTLADAFATREDVFTDPETGLMEKVTSEVVYSLPTLSEQAAGVGVTYKEVATGVWIKETRQALASDGTPINPASNAAYYTFTWETEEDFVFPSYQLPLDAGLFPRAFMPSQRRTVCKFKLPIRLSFRGLARVRYTETFHAAQPTRPGSILDLTGRDWVQEGLLVNFNVKNVLMDDPNTAFYDVATLAGDTFYGAYTERIAAPQFTTLTGSTYHLAVLNAGQPSLTAWRVQAEVKRGPNKTFRMLLKEVWLK
jgi:hypothetical protein